MLTLHSERLHTTLAAARTQQTTQTWKEKYALRSGMEWTNNQAMWLASAMPAIAGCKRCGLQYVFSATAINVIRLDAHWTEHDQGRS